jgi:hypothetical protein
MARDAAYWARKEHFERTGEWPETPAQARRREAKEREQAHPAVSQQLSDAPKVESTEKPQETHTEKVVRLWHEANPGFR